MSQFRKKPVVIEAISFDELVKHCHEQRMGHQMPLGFSYAGHGITQDKDDSFLIPTLEGIMEMGRTDMLITGVKGEIYPCKRDIFDLTYEPVAA